MAVLSFAAGIIFWWSVRDLDAREDELNNMSAGSIDTYNDEKLH